MIRDPIAQDESYLSFMQNYKYYREYPIHKCKSRQHINLHSTLKPDRVAWLMKSVTKCNDTPFRKNLTLIHTAHRIRNTPTHAVGDAAATTYSLITGASRGNVHNLKEDSILQIMKNRYILVGVTERLNQFLVALALAHRWNVSALYYRPCKINNLKVSSSEFESIYPDAVRRLKHNTQFLKRVHEQVRDEFDQQVAKLGPWFLEKVAEFEQGLKDYRERNFGHLVGESKYKWKKMKYLDGEVTYC